jgi:hypothetical protein
LASAYPEVFQKVLSVAGGLDGITNSITPYNPATGTEITDVSNRVANVASVLNTHSIKVWAIVGTKDTETPAQASINICAGVSNSKCTQVNSSHAGVLDHCLTIRNEILDFFI